MKNVCIIPARAGSKRIKNKNIKPLAGVPLIEWTIRSAIDSGLFDSIIISTDSVDIANIASKAGIDVNALRPEKLSGDEVTAEDLIGYYVDKIDADAFCYLQPTSPFRNSFDIISSYEKLISTGANAVISVSETDYPAQWLYDPRVPFETFMSKLSNKRSQDSQRGLVLNGAVYWFTRIAFKKYKTHLIDEGVIPYIMPKNRSIDIDWPEDFELAEDMVKRNAI
jgi:CMP-N-acetylneuraminic acid synthetase